MHVGSVPGEAARKGGIEGLVDHTWEGHVSQRKVMASLRVMGSCRTLLLPVSPYPTSSSETSSKPVGCSVEKESEEEVHRADGEPS